MIIKRNLLAVAAFATLSIVSCTKDEDTTVAPVTVETKTAGFEDVAVNTMGYYNGDDSKGDFVSGGVTFQNEFTKSQWGDYWSKGFSVSNVVNIDTAGAKNQYATYAGKGANGTTNYVVGQKNAKITFPDSVKLKELYVTNSTYAALSIKNGDSFAKKFGTVVKDTSGTVTDNGQDWFLLTVKGFKTASDSVAINKIEFYLADFRNGKSEVIKDWTKLDLSSLANARCLKFELTSSDVGQWGMNTPAYFAIDEITYTK